MMNNYFNILIARFKPSLISSIFIWNYGAMELWDIFTECHPRMIPSQIATSFYPDFPTHLFIGFISHSRSINQVIISDTWFMLQKIRMSGYCLSGYPCGTVLGIKVFMEMWGWIVWFQGHQLPGHKMGKADILREIIDNLMRSYTIIEKTAR